MRRCLVRRASCVVVCVALGCQARAGDGGSKSPVEFNGRTAFTYIQRQM